MAQLTVADVLELPIVRAARPEVVAGHRQLGSRIRWVHTTELTDIADLLRGGELVLSTGLALPDDAEAAGRFATSLVEVRAAGLMIELGRRWEQALPEALVSAFEQAGLPLVALRAQVRFAAVAQVVGERIVDDQLSEPRLAESIHDTFTALTLSDALPLEILDATQRLSGSTVVLESEHHRVIDFVAGSDGDDFLDDWYDRSRQVPTTERTSWDQPRGWLIARVGSLTGRGDGWCCTWPSRPRTTTT